MIPKNVTVTEVDGLVTLTLGTASVSFQASIDPKIRAHQEHDSLVHLVERLDVAAPAKAPVKAPRKKTMK